MTTAITAASSCPAAVALSSLSSSSSSVSFLFPKPQNSSSCICAVSAQPKSSVPHYKLHPPAIAASEQKPSF
ncbi:hypothetical protein ACFX2G_019453 [Malus domestica]